MSFASGFFKPGLWPYVLPVLLLICSLRLVRPSQV